MTPEEVRLILKGWHDNDSQLILVGSFSAVTCLLRCRISKADEGRVSLTTEGGMLTFDFSDHYFYVSCGLSNKLHKIRDISCILRARAIA